MRRCLNSVHLLGMADEVNFSRPRAFGASDRSEPQLLRRIFRARLYDALEDLSQIVNDPDTRNADRIKAIEVMAKYGLGSADQAAVHIHAGEGSQVIGVVHLPALDPVPDEEEGEPGEVAASEPVPPERQLPAG